MSSLTWSVQQTFQQSDFYWKWDENPTTVELGTSANPLAIIPAVSYPRLVNFSILRDPAGSIQTINFFLHPTFNGTNLETTAKPDFQAQTGHQQLDWAMSAAVYAKKMDPNEYGIFITYRCAIKEYL